MHPSSEAASGSQDQGIARKLHEPVLDSQPWLRQRLRTITGSHRCVAITLGVLLRSYGLELALGNASERIML
jgi:hypothetical protein